MINHKISLRIVLNLIVILALFNLFHVALAQDGVSRNFTAHYEKYTPLGINGTFSLSGSIISTIKANSSVILSADTNSGTKNVNNISDSNLNLLDEGNKTTSSSRENSITDMDPYNINESLGSSSPPKTSEISNQTDNFSNNLVSMLSGIIIQSIEKGNPTITNMNLSETNPPAGENISTIVTGNWRLNVVGSNVTMFDARLLMITSTGTGFHWHLLNNFRGTNEVYFGNDGNIFLNGYVDFYTDNKESAKNVNINIFINNLETIQISLNNNKISNHFYGFPIYGTIDLVELPN